MRWAGWSYDEYMDAPADVVDTLRELVVELNQHSSRARGHEADLDEKEYELEKVVTPEGRVEKRRESSPGDKVIDEFFGPPPKRKGTSGK